MYLRNLPLQDTLFNDIFYSPVLLPVTRVKIEKPSINNNKSHFLFPETIVLAFDDLEVIFMQSTQKGDI